MDLPDDGGQSAMAFEVAEPYRFNFEVAWEVAHKGELKLLPRSLSNRASHHIERTDVSSGFPLGVACMVVAPRRLNASKRHTSAWF